DCTALRGRSARRRGRSPRPAPAGAPLQLCHRQSQGGAAVPVAVLPLRASQRGREPRELLARCLLLGHDGVDAVGRPSAPAGGPRAARVQGVAVAPALDGGGAISALTPAATLAPAGDAGEALRVSLRGRREDRSGRAPRAPGGPRSVRRDIPRRCAL